MAQAPLSDGEVRRERLWVPVDPSGQLRAACHESPADRHSQLVLNRDPSRVLQESCNHAPLMRSSLEVVSTGECLRFPGATPGVAAKLVEGEIGAAEGRPSAHHGPIRPLQFSEAAEKGEQGPSAENAGSASSDVNSGGPKICAHGTNAKRNEGEVVPLWGSVAKYNRVWGLESGSYEYDYAGCVDNRGPRDGEVDPLLERMANELKRLPLVRSSCESCRRSCLLGSGADQRQQPREQNVPCPHALGLRHTPQVQSLAALGARDAARAAASFYDVPRPRGDQGDPTAAAHGGKTQPAPPTSMPLRLVSFEAEEAGTASDSDGELDYLLTYRQATLRGEGYNFNEDSKFDVEKLMEGGQTDVPMLEELDTTLLRNVAARLRARNDGRVDAVAVLRDLVGLRGDETNGQFNRDGCVALTGAVVDRHASKQEMWVCPSRFRVAGVRSAQAAQLSEAPTTRYDTAEEATHSDMASTTRSHNVESEPLQQPDGLGPPERSLSAETDDTYYDSDMPLEVLMAKYLRLRKQSDCAGTILKTLKHLICLRLNKERLYLKRRAGSGEAGGAVDPAGENVMLQTLYRVLNTIPLLDAKGGATSRAPDDVEAPGERSDDASVYTYSSISVSSYQSVQESIFVPVDEYAIARSWACHTHRDVVGIYGIMAVTDENNAGLFPRERCPVYCELIGDALYMHEVREAAPSAAEVIESQPHLVVHLDGTFTCAPLKSRVDGGSLLRLSGANYEVRGAAPPESEESGIFLKLAAPQEEVLRWWAALTARSKLLSFRTLLESEHRVSPHSTNLDFILYPNRREVNLAGLQFDPVLESRIVHGYVRKPVRSLDASHRQLSDAELGSFAAVWDFKLETVDLSWNMLTLHECGQAFVAFVHKTRVQRLYLDGNPLCAQAAELLPELFFGGALRYLSLRGCAVDEGVVRALKQLNQSMAASDRFTVDVRGASASDAVMGDLKSFPFNRVKVVTANEQLALPERGLETFMDCHTMNEIARTGALYAGCLLPAQSNTAERIRFCGLCIPRKKTYRLGKDYVFFEYRAPYLIARDVGAARPRRGQERPPEVLFLSSCEIALMNNLRWLQLKGTAPRAARGVAAGAGITRAGERSLLVRAYSDGATRRWFELINRTLAGMRYVEYLRKHPGTVISKHILSFCRRPDASHLVLYELPYDREMWPRFFRCLNSQLAIKVMDFSNMRLTAEQLEFPRLLFGGLELDRLDFSFNHLALGAAGGDVFNGLLPPLKCALYNVSDNPLGDCARSAELFVAACTRAEARKVCFNRCGLGDCFLEQVLSGLSRGEESSGALRLQVVELEGNCFSSGRLQEFLGGMTAAFPSLEALRLHGSVDSPELSELRLAEHSVVSVEPCSATEPPFGGFVRKKLVQKPKRTTRESVERLVQQRLASSGA